MANPAIILLDIRHRQSLYAPRPGSIFVCVGRLAKQALIAFFEATGWRGSSGG
jgi:hypothetical protein